MRPADLAIAIARRPAYPARVGDWCTTYHWFECDTPGDARQVLGRLRGAASYRWTDRERWAVRAGQLAPRLVQAESVVKYGASLGLAQFVRERVPSAHALQLCHGYGVDVAGAGALRPAWNYLLVKTGVDRRRAAEALGGRAPDDAPGLVCLPEPVPLAVERPDARLVAALDVLRGLADQRCRLVLGLWTAAHGYVHLAGLELTGRADYWPPGGGAELTLDGGGHNHCEFPVTVGPFARSTYTERPPTIPAPRIAWPFARP